ncbi:MerR family transcriptional regulator [Pseudomonas sp. ADAK18]|uniref:MerR family transcriptional regulator n=1 Tax=Pseudomonas sp. ADAK18 TaxID=2730848 RepID=UPI0014649A59|nr:MerR family transcriptional regulator [Pseudomonas sp. ADAK18]QJI27387.1 MerR family transcriptional regulator [Pseudomonas sp. ADAK18]
MATLTALLDGFSLTGTVDSEEFLPIREVSRLTGVNPVTLRAWERRYGLIQPTRTESGHRLYSKADVDTVHRVLDWIERGVAVSKVGKILARDDQQAAAVRVVAQESGSHEWGEWQSQLWQAISAFDDRQLCRLYGQIFAAYPITVVFQDILMPLWHQLSRHQGQFGQASEWLFFDAFLSSRAIQRLQLAAASAAPRVLLAAMPGECRSLELLVAGVLLGSEELTAQVLGMGQPFDELTLVCEKTRPRALVVFSNHSPTHDLSRRLNRLAMTLECPLLLAGDASDLAQEALAGSSIGCLGNDARLMQQRLWRFLSGTLDT